MRGAPATPRSPVFPAGSSLTRSPGEQGEELSRVAAPGPAFRGAVPGGCEFLSLRIRVSAASRVPAAAACACLPGRRDPRAGGRCPLRGLGEGWDRPCPRNFLRPGAIQLRRAPCVLKAAVRNPSDAAWTPAARSPRKSRFPSTSWISGSLSSSSWPPLSS